MSSAIPSDDPLPFGADAFEHRSSNTLIRSSLQAIPPLETPLKASKIIYLAVFILILCAIATTVGISLTVALKRSSSFVILTLVGGIGSIASVGIVFLLWRDRRCIRRLQQEGLRLEAQRWQVQIREKDQQIAKFSTVQDQPVTASVPDEASYVHELERAPADHISSSDNGDSQAVQVSKSMPKMKAGHPVHSDDYAKPNLQGRLHILQEINECSPFPPSRRRDERVEIRPGSGPAEACGTTPPPRKGSAQNLAQSRSNVSSLDRRVGIQRQAVQKVDDWMGDVSDPIHKTTSNHTSSGDLGGPSRHASLAPTGVIGLLRQNLTREPQAIDPPPRQDLEGGHSELRGTPEESHMIQKKFSSLPILGRYGKRCRET